MNIVEIQMELSAVNYLRISNLWKVKPDILFHWIK